MTFRSYVAKFARGASLPLFKHVPIERWPELPARLHGIHVPSRVVPGPTKTAASGVNINTVFHLLEQTLHTEGDVAECGVFRGATLIPIGLFLKQRGISKNVIGFDSFEGFDESVNIDIRLGGRDIESKRVGGLADTSYQGLAEKIDKFGLSSTVTLAKGYFHKTLPLFASRRFCFVHLDCDLYQSYRECMEFVYPRLSPGGIILFDEYNDPPWPGCNKAIDEFLADKPERPIEIALDNFSKWYIKKQ